MNLEIIGMIGEHNIELFNLYLKGLISESELKSLTENSNYKIELLNEIHHDKKR